MNYERMMALSIPQARQELSDDACILYALGTGFGRDPMHEGQLRHLYEEGLEVLPTMANVLAHPGFWLRNPEIGVDWKRVLHLAQAFTIHRPIEPGQRLIGRSRITGINDKGPAKGAILFTRREVETEGSEDLLCTVEQTTMLRGDGGGGGDDPPPRPIHPLPDRPADLHHDLAIPLDAALIYRLSGDRNPLHIDPAVARQAGFERPILHGMCTMGYAGHSLMAALCDYEGERIRSMQVRFTAPVWPGESLRTEMWPQEKGVSFRTRALERDAIVLDNGYADLD